MQANFLPRRLPQPVVDQCQQLYFRQSFVKDYLLCPQMALYRWVLSYEASDTFFSALLGTAGHAVIDHMHSTGNFTMSYTDIMVMFEQEFHKALASIESMPNLSSKHDSVESQFQSRSADYCDAIHEYRKDERNTRFHTIFTEQLFVLVVPDITSPDNPFIFTGQIDQGGYYDDGSLAVRDLKFRIEATRPTHTELKLDTQFTTYATALRYATPACDTCRPRYIEDFATTELKLTYEGPCESCAAQTADTKRWPAQFPDICEMIWMFDYHTYKRDQYQQWLTDRDAPKVLNPETGRLVYAKKVNPKYLEGYKKGDYRGPIFLSSRRDPTTAEILFSDIITTCELIRQGSFHRKPGSHCQLWCKHQEQCLQGLELDAETADMSNLDSFVTEDF